MMRLIYLVSAFFLLSVLSLYGQQPQQAQPVKQAQQPQQAQQPPENIFAGEFQGWKVNVSATNYNFVKSAILIFGTRWSAPWRTEGELEQQIWDQLILSFEAFRRGVKTEQQELDTEITKIISADKVTFDWKKNPKAYEHWVKNKLGEPVDVFENQLRHLVQLEKLRSTVLDSIKPEVTEEEVRNEFLNEHNNIELELAQFDSQKEAQDYFDKTQDPLLWEKQAKDDPKFYKHPGFVSLEFLIDLWKIPKDDLYRMLKMENNSIYHPIPIYKGYGVSRVLQKRQANEADFSKMRDSYFKQVETKKKYEGLNAWLKQLKEEAKIKAIWIVY